MTRVLSYNILAGGQSLHAGRRLRTEPLARMIREARPDIVGLPEGINVWSRQPALVVEELAEELGMQLVRGDHPSVRSEFQVALLTRLPVVRAQVHLRPGILTRPLLEVCVEEENGHLLTVFVAHLLASFHKGRRADRLRRREVQEILRIMSSLQGEPHLLMGDFNALAPGDRLQASALLRYVVDLDQARRQKHIGDGQPNLSYVVPERLHFLNPLLRLIPRSRALLGLVDIAASLYVPRGSIALLRAAGYIDCFRRLHPDERGFTCPASAPAGRIDFIFASPELATRLQTCTVVTEVAGMRGAEASDHLPVLAEFGAPVPALAHEPLAAQALTQ